MIREFGCKWLLKLLVLEAIVVFDPSVAPTTISIFGDFPFVHVKVDKSLVLVSC